MILWSRQILEAGLLGLRAALGAAAALGLASYAGLDHPIYALIAAILVTEYSASETRRLGGQRLIATFLGVAVALALITAFPPGLWTAGVGILMAFALCQATGLKAGTKLAAYLSALVILDNSGDPFTYAAHRIIETALGIIVALGISLVPRLVNFDARE